MYDLLADTSCLQVKKYLWNNYDETFYKNS